MKQKSDIEMISDQINVLLKNCTRIEVIDDKGRCYHNWKETNKISISLQDDFKTLKIFIEQK